jgi:demethylmenaquinone methyltransferase/2-methoxy-6-polyprenyl-1,4-benzoquinol methylase
MVKVGTFGCDPFWKKKILAKVPPTATRVLDLACGTGIVTFAIARQYPNCHVIGVDLTKEYLDVARAKTERWKIANVEFIHQRAEEVMFDGPFDCVTASYLPKYADLKTLIPNLKVMLKKDGVLVMHDFTYPTNRIVASIWEFYFRLLQTVGRRIFPKWGTIYDELPRIVRETTWVSDLVASLQQNGFREILVERLIVGSAALVTARNGKQEDRGPGG